MKINKSKQTATTLTASASIILSSTIAIFFESKLGAISLVMGITSSISMYWLSVKIIKEEQDHGNS